MANFLLSNLKSLPEGVMVMPACPTKKSHIGKPLKEFFFLAFESNSNFCPANILKMYVERTQSIRKTENSLFLMTTPKYHSAIAAATTRWIKTGLSKVGIDTSIFKVHSICSTSTSAAADAGLSVSEIMEAADWSSASVFEVLLSSTQIFKFWPLNNFFCFKPA